MLSLLDDPDFDQALQRHFTPARYAATPPAPPRVTFGVHVTLNDGTQVHYLAHGGIAFDHILDAHEKFGQLAQRLEVAPIPQQPQEAA